MAAEDLSFRFMSQVKPGPKVAAAVAMKVSRRESKEEKEESMVSRKAVEQVSLGGFGLGVYIRRLVSDLGNANGNRSGWKDRVGTMGGVFLEKVDIQGC